MSSLAGLWGGGGGCLFPWVRLYIFLVGEAFLFPFAGNPMLILPLVPLFDGHSSLLRPLQAKITCHILNDAQ